MKNILLIDNGQMLGDEQPELYQVMPEQEAYPGQYAGPSIPFFNMDGDDFAGDSSTTGVLTIDGPTVNGNLDFDGDKDWFGITVAAGDIVNIAIQSSISIAELEFFTADNSPAPVTFGFTDGNPGPNTDVEFIEAGTFYVQIAQGFGSSALGSYSVTASRLEDDIAGDISTTGVLEINGPGVTSRQDFIIDRDWFAFDANAGDLINFMLETSGGFYQLTLFDSNGDSIGGAGTNSDLSFTFDQAGTYYLEVIGSVNTDYTVSALRADTDEFEDSASTTGEVVVDGPATTGAIQFSFDEDWIGVTVEVGQTVRFVLEVDDPESLSAGMELVRADGFFLSLGVDSQTNPGTTTLTYSFEEAGTFYLAIGAPENNLGQYALTAISIADEAGASPESAAELPTDGQVLSGNFDFEDDTDWYEFTVGSGDVVEFIATSSDFSTGQSLAFNLYNADGSFFNGKAFDDPIAGGAILTQQFNQGGTYYVEIDSIINEIAPYELQAFLQTDDFTDDVTTSGVLALDDDATGNIDFYQDRDWFSFSIASPQEVLLAVLATNNSFEGPLIEVFDSAGQLVFTGDQGDTFSNLVIVDFQITGTFFIGISSGANRNFTENVTGAYSLSAITVGDNDIIGTVNNDVLAGTNNDDVIKGLFGDDLLSGLAGNDELFGSLGQDTLNGGDGDDLLVGGAGDDILNGGIGRDVLEGGSGRDELNGGSSADTLIGGSNNDVLNGQAGNDVLFGNGGIDTLTGGDGDDQLDGGGGRDLLDGGLGNDDIVGGDGADRIFGGDGDDIISGRRGSDTIDGGAGNDVIAGRGLTDVISGGEGDDTLRGNGGRDTLNGDAGNDLLVGGQGNDILNGGADDDRLDGRAGDDILSGGSGVDILLGKGGNDVFIFAADHDETTIMDFIDGEDMIDLSDFGFASLAAATALMSEAAGNVIFSLNGDTLTINNTTIAALQDDILI
ncbi:MAG: pre-peptidase C-terminal domain-containing protein [Aquisalinus sp.]|nr:pre-peptidase C-terminal domain-containing protein [Aquisalinus sp.]